MSAHLKGLTQLLTIKPIKPIILCLALLTLCGCTNPYTEYYRAVAHGDPSSLKLHTGEPELYISDNMDRDIQKLEEDGYDVIGYSNFEGPENSMEAAKEQGKKIGAAVILVSKSYPRRINPRVVAHNMPEPNAPSNYTTIRGDRYEYLAFYWAKVDNVVFGAKLRNLSIKEKKKLERSYGVFVKAVIKGSPAQKAKIARGDIITMIEDNTVTDYEYFQKMLIRNKGKDIKLFVLRNGAVITVPVRLNK